MSVSTSAGHCTHHFASDESMLLDAAYAHAGISGFSMGGVHACMVASLYPNPIACVPLLAPRSASVAFCHGALREATAWQPLLAAADEANKDVDATVLQAAQANLVTAAAQRVLQACKEAGQQPLKEVNSQSFCSTCAGRALRSTPFRCYTYCQNEYAECNRVLIVPNCILPSQDSALLPDDLGVYT